MRGPVLQFEDLQDICRPGKRPRLPTVTAWADQLGLRYKYDGDGGIWTTVDALNVALGITAANPPLMDPLDPREFFGDGPRT